MDVHARESGSPMRSNSVAPTYESRTGDSLHRPKRGFDYLLRNPGRGPNLRFTSEPWEGSDPPIYFGTLGGFRTSDRRASGGQSPPAACALGRLPRRLSSDSAST